MFSWFRRGQHPAILRRVLVSLVSGNAVEGLLVEQIGDEYVLKDCTVHVPGEQPAGAVGEICVNRWNVDYIQRIADREV